MSVRSAARRRLILAVGGAGDSYHCKGQAMDIAVSDGRDRYLMLTALLNAGFNRIGLYAKGWIQRGCGVNTRSVASSRLVVPCPQ